MTIETVNKRRGRRRRADQPTTMRRVLDLLARHLVKIR